MTMFKAIALSIAVSAASVSIAAPAFADTVAAHGQTHSFVKKSKSIKGSFHVVERGEKTFIVFSDDFKAKRGPDLKVFLSPTGIRSANGKNAVTGSINLGKLQTNKGAQEYEVPAGVDLANFESVLVHCEAYSVLWGGSDI